MGKELHFNADRERGRVMQTYETELSFSRWNRGEDSEHARSKVRGGFQTVNGLDKDLELSGGNSTEIGSQRSLGMELGWEKSRKLTNSRESADSIRETETGVDQSHYVYGHAATREVNFDDNKENAAISDEEFEREFGFTADQQRGLQSRLDEENSNANQLNGYSNMQQFEHFEEETQRAPINGSLERKFVFRSVIRTLFYILIWYIFSTSLTLYNKLLLGADLGQFPAPFLMNTIHFSMQAVISTIVLRFFCRSSVLPVCMSWRDYFSRVVPTAIATALDIDLSNASFIFISVTFATMCKSATPVFLLLFAFIFKLEAPSFKLLGIIAVISAGVLLAVAKETQFNLGGFILVMLSAVMAGFRWAVMQILLQKEEYGLNSPFAAMSYLTPIMAVVTAIFSLATEPWHKLRQTHYFDTPHHIFESSLLMLLGGSLAFFMVLTEYLLISETSALTLMVAGIVKEVVTIVVAIILFHDNITILKVVGLIIIIIGVSLFNCYKYQKMMEGKPNNHPTLTKYEPDQSTTKYRILTDESSSIDEPGETRTRRGVEV